MSTLSTAQAEKLLADISQYIDESHAILETGNFVELAGLDANVKSLCDAMPGLSDKDRERFTPQLEVLGAQLEKLAALLYEQRDKVAEEMQQASGSRKASIAYQTANAIDGKKES